MKEHKRHRDQAAAMDALITTIIAGAVIAVIGAFATYYFGRRRERQIQVYEREREAERQQEEKRREEQKQQEEQQRELNKRRAEAFDEIQARAYSIMDALSAWLERAKMLSEGEPEKGAVNFVNVENLWRPYFEELARTLEKMYEIKKEMQSLQHYYQVHESYLEPSARRLFLSFDEEVIERYFAETLWEEESTGEIMSPDETLWAMQELLRTLDQIEEQRKDASVSINNEGLDTGFRETSSEVESEFVRLYQELQKDWDLQAYRTAFHNEKRQNSG